MSTHLTTKALLTLSLTVFSGCDTEDAERQPDAQQAAAYGKADGAAAPVRLVRANMQTRRSLGAGGGCPCSYSGRLTGVVEVEDIAFDKEVAVHYSNGGTWERVQASYLGAAADGRELWTFETDAVNQAYGIDTDFTFAVEYRVAGQTYWDNHQSQDFCAGVGEGDLDCFNTVLGSNTMLALSQAVYEPTSDNGRFHGDVVVRDVAYDKTIEVIYTTDDWATIDTVAATFSGDVDADSELWSFSVDGPSSDQIEFAISYTVGTRTHWDSNNGQNYRVDRNGVVHLIPDAQ